MISVLDLLNKYLDIERVYTNTILFIKGSNSDTEALACQFLLEYFYDFKSFNRKIVLEKLCNSNNIRSMDRINRLLNNLNELSDIYSKYHINNLDEITLLILDTWNKHREYSDEIVKKVLIVSKDGFFLSGLNKFRFRKDVSVLSIYKDMVDMDMIKNPNLSVGTSGEMLYTMLPEDSSCYDSNLKVISDPIIDWSIYRNGCNPLEHFCFKYNNSKSEQEKMYYHDLIITAILGSCSLFNNIFARYSFSKKIEKSINYYLVAGINKDGNIRHNIKDVEFINEIYNLLLTDKFFNHQMELYTEKNSDAEEVIKELKLSRENK